MSDKGKWVVYSEDGSKAIIENESPEIAYEKAIEMGIDDPVLAYSPPEGSATFY